VTKTKTLFKKFNIYIIIHLMFRQGVSRNDSIHPYLTIHICGGNLMLRRFRFFTVLMLSFIMIFSLSSGAMAATVGQQLTTPEAGWARYDDTSKLIFRVGSYKIVNDSNFYGGSAYHSTGSDSKINFEFVGTKIRLIGYTYTPYRVTEVDVFIDGSKVGTFSQVGAIVKQNLDFEITGLSQGRHSVDIVPHGSQELLNYVLDAVDIDDTGYLIDTSIIAPVLSAKAAVRQIDLNWTTDSNVTNYSIKRSLIPGGPYTEVSTSTYGTFSDLSVENGVTYYYVVTAVNVNGESAYSNEASATPQGPVIQPETGRAILTITLDTGLEKEYDLSLAEVNFFISWYEGKAAGSGTASYAIDKHDNNKGPFKNRKDYVIFDKILTFEINEYEVTE
jgi:hypothetical protein